MSPPPARPYVTFELCSVLNPDLPGDRMTYAGRDIHNSKVNRIQPFIFFAKLVSRRAVCYYYWVNGGLTN